MSPRRLTGTDALLAVLALLGAGLYAFLLPSQHPDAALDYALGSAGAIEAGDAFLQTLGYTTGGLSADAYVRRDANLLDSLQRSLGRPEAVSFLASAGGDDLPAYTWRARWQREDDTRYRLTLGTGGEVWELSTEGNGEGPAFDRAAIRAALADPTTEARLPADSLLASTFTFVEDDSLWADAERDTLDVADIRSGLDFVASQPSARFSKALGPAWAVALARYHLQNTALAGVPVRIDGVSYVRPSRGEDEQRPARARVAFMPERPIGEQRVRTEIVVEASGVLTEIRTDATLPVPGAEQEDQEEEDEEGASISVSSEGVATIAYGLVGLVLLVVFFRRLGGRLIDGRMALRDAFWGGVFVALLVLTLVGQAFANDFDQAWLGVLAGMAVGLGAGVFSSLLIFFVSSAADSIGRDAWPEKLRTWTLVRQGYLRNVPVGAALLRGGALALLLLGLATLTLLFLPSAPLSLGAFGDGDEFIHTNALSAVGAVFGFYGYGALFGALGVLVGIGTLLYRWKPRAWLVVPMLALVLAAVGSGPVGSRVDAYAWAFAGVTGTVLALAFWRYDALTAFVGYLFFSMLWALSPGWLVEGLPMLLDFGIAAGGLATALGIGAVGLVSGRSGDELQEYVPAYVEERATQERLNRELEIAHQVQEFFLPRQTPTVDGLDVAAMCLPAQEVGGDYFDFVELGPGRLGVAIGDVSGKGIQAAFFMTLVKGFWQTLVREVDSPAEVLRRLNTLFRANAPRGTFITMVYGVIDVESRTFTFARAGHNPIILKRSPSQEPEMVQPGGIGIGLASGAPFDHIIEEETLHLRPGDVLVFYTDGFSEAMNAARDLYGDDRLARKVGDLGRKSANEILRAVSEDVHHFVEAVGRHDDMTMVVAKLSRRSDPVTRVTAGRVRAVEGEASEQG